MPVRLNLPYDGNLFHKRTSTQRQVKEAYPTMSEGLKGRRNTRRIAMHAIRLSEHIEGLVKNLREQGHDAEADYLGTAKLACAAAALSLAERRTF